MVRWFDGLLKILLIDRKLAIRKCELKPLLPTTFLCEKILLSYIPNKTTVYEILYLIIVTYD